MNTFNHSIAEGKPYWTWGPLIFTGFYFLPTIIDWVNISIQSIAYIMCLFIAFIFLYSKAVYAKGDNVIPWLITMTLLVAFGTYFTLGTQTLFGYIAFIAGFNLSLKKSIFSLVTLLLIILLTGIVYANASLYFYAPALLISTGLFFFGAFTQRDISHQIKESKSQAQIEQLATIGERERIARDLHDVIGHNLSSIALKAELAGKYINLQDNDNARTEIEAVASMSREMLADVRHAVSGLKLHNLNAKFNQLVNELINQGLQVDSHYALKNLPVTVESALSFILTESVTNIMRHSNATTVKINLFVQDQQACLRISDNGTCASYSKGNGLTGINERCKLLNGALIINTEHGFSLSVTLPNAE